ncbi:MAG TPA: type I phosphomannose isomerase catalytic subunit [Bacteroidales bacterium]|nr:type I phosphomannose isomerase catalytic subunit [Bacteroidales bacterium]
MNQLYPLKFKPIIKDKIWGGTRLRQMLNKKCKTDKAGESWEISGYPGSVSRVKNGFLAGNSLEELIEVYMGDLVGDGVFEKFGTLFPLLVKFIDANDTLSVQVHPGDDLARRQFESYGKTEMWYVIAAEKDAEIIVGFNKQLSKDAFMDHMNNKTLLSVLNTEKTHPGDVFFLPAGRVHATGGGILVAEIQQTSDATLRIYDYDRLDDKGNTRELHIEKALEAIDFKLYPAYKTRYEKKPGLPNLLAKCEYFTTNLFTIDNEIERYYVNLDSFVIYMCLEGSFTLRYRNGAVETAEKGETLLLPAEIKNVAISPKGPAKFLEVYIEGLTDGDQTNNILEKLF